MDRMKDYKQLIRELPSSTFVCALGEFNPPTVAHEVLVKTVKIVAEQNRADHTIFTSPSELISEEKKFHFLEMLFPKTKFTQLGESFFTSRIKLLSEKYRNVIIVAGSDQFTEFKKLKEFNNVKVICIESKDPDINQSKMKQFATKGIYEDFKKLLPSAIRDIDAKRLMNEMRLGMNLEPIKEQIVLVKDKLREKYFKGEIFNEGDLVESDGKQYTIIKRGSNHLLLKEETGQLVSKWIQDVKIIEGVIQQNGTDQIKPNGPENDNTTAPQKPAGVKKGFLTFYNYSTKQNQETNIKEGLFSSDPKPDQAALDRAKLAAKHAKEKQALSIKHKREKESLKEEELDESSVYDTYVKNSKDYSSVVKTHGVEKTKKLIDALKTERDSLRKQDWAGPKHVQHHDFAIRGLQRAIGEEFQDIDIILQTLEEAISTIDKGEYDYEGAMARTQLQTVVRNSQELISMLSMDDNMPEWVQSKITLAQDYISTVRDYLKSREELGEETKKKKNELTQKEVPTQLASQATTFDPFFKEEDIDEIVNSVTDEEIEELYEESELAIIDEETGEELEVVEGEDKIDLMEVLSRQERMKQKMRLRKTAAKRKRSTKIALKRYSNTQTINKRARRLAIKLMKKRLLRGRDPSKISVGEKERVERTISKSKDVINRVAQRLTSRVRKVEKNRMSHGKFTKGSMPSVF
jgi:hypothetical protein